MYRDYHILDDLRNLDDEEAKDYIGKLFAGYVNRKKEKRLFEEHDGIPEILILTYYTCVAKPKFYNVYQEFKDKYIPEDQNKNFKERYIYNENKLEDVHTKEERSGLRLVYGYIQEKQDLDNISIYTLSDIHEILYKLTPYPEFGGRYRRDQALLSHSGINITPPYLIVREMNELRYDVSDLVTMGNELGQNIEPDRILEYVDKCVELKCKLIKIHPFGDGNGRSIRAFTNLLFKLANIPPVYIENRERVKYVEAMQSALGDGDLTKIKQFYHYKICDSIISLDTHLEDKIDMSTTRKSSEKQKTKKL